MNVSRRSIEWLFAHLQFGKPHALPASDKLCQLTLITDHHRADGSLFILLLAKYLLSSTCKKLLIILGKLASIERETISHFLAPYEKRVFLYEEGNTQGIAFNVEEYDALIGFYAEDSLELLRKSSCDAFLLLFPKHNRDESFVHNWLRYHSSMHVNIAPLSSGYSSSADGKISISPGILCNSAVLLSDDASWKHSVPLNFQYKILQSGDDIQVWHQS